MEAEAREHGEGQGAENETDLGHSDNDARAAINSRFNPCRREQAAFDAGERRSGPATQAGGETEAKAKSVAGTPGTTCCGYEGALGGKKSCDRGESAKRLER